MKDHGKKQSQHSSHLISGNVLPLCITENKCFKEGRYGGQYLGIYLTEGRRNTKEVQFHWVFFAIMYFAIRAAEYFQEIQTICHRRNETGTEETVWR